MRPVVCRWSSLSGKIERILRDSHLTTRRIENLRCGVLEAAPGIVDSCAHAVAEALVELSLQRVVPGFARIAPETNHAASRVHTLGAERPPRVAVERLIEIIPERADISDTQRKVRSEFPLHLEAVL